VAHLLQWGQQWLNGQLEKHASHKVDYQRGLSSISVRATIGRTLLKLDDGYGGVLMQWTDRDFLIPASQLVLDGETTLPERGDLIHEIQGDWRYTYEVLAPGREPHWKWSDLYRSLLRVHTKQIRVEPL
jgi:hypothetical protein